MSRFFSLVALTLFCSWPMQSLQAQDSFSIDVSSGGNGGTELLTVEMAAQHSLLTLDNPVAMALTLNSPSSSTGFGLVVSFPDKTFDKKIKDIGTKYPPQKWPLGAGTVTIGGHTLPTYRPPVPATPTKPKDAGSGTQGVVEVAGTTETAKVSSGVQGPHKEQAVQTVITTVKTGLPSGPNVQEPTKTTNNNKKAAINGMLTHAEMDAVAISILGGDVDVEVTINNPGGPCANCQAGAKLLLKNGVTLTVHFPGGGKTVITGTR